MTRVNVPGTRNKATFSRLHDAMNSGDAEIIWVTPLHTSY
jgi:hypothetical protein